MGNALNFTLGLDLAQASFDAALAPEGSDIMAWRRLAHTHIEAPPDSIQGVGALVQWVASEAPAGRCLKVVVESTGTLSRRVAAALNPTILCTAAMVAIVNPRRTKAFGDSLGVRDKNDRVDCAILAMYGLTHKPAPTILRSAVDEELRELTRLREAMVGEKTGWLSRLGEVTGTTARHLIESHIADLEKRIEKIEAQIDKRIEANEVLCNQVKALKRIKGIGPTTARTITAELGDLRVYSRGQIVAVVGIFPTEFSSGNTVWRRPRLAKGGGGRVRRVLYMCATCLFHSQGAIRAWIQTKLDEGRAPMTVTIMLMRKLLLIARAVMLAGGHFDPSLVGKKEALAS